MAIRNLNHLTFQRLAWTDLCPLGVKYKRTKLEDVPPSFLLWAYSREWVYEKYPALHDFIKRNWDTINEDADIEYRNNSGEWADADPSTTDKE